MEIQGVAKLCYSRGFRDKNLITMVSISGAETNYNESFDDGGQLGLFGIRPFGKAISGNLLEAEYNSIVARDLYERKSFASWISYATDSYLKFVERSIQGIGKFYLTLYNIQ